MAAVNNIWARLKSAQAGVRTPNSYALLGENGELAAQPIGNGRSFFVDPQNGSNNNDGRTWAKAYATVAKALTSVDSYDYLFINGVVKEQCVAPLGVFDVTIIGGANRTRQATSSGTPTGGGATWLAPTSPTATTPLLHLREQGWTIANVFFNGPTDAASIKLHREENATYPDASHFSALGCRFASGFIGIEDYGGHSDLLIEECSFEGLTGAGGGAIKVTNQGIDVPNAWLFRNNRILPCVNGIVGAFRDCVFENNKIHKSTTTTINLASGNTGLRNFVTFNFFNILAADFDPVGGIIGNATDTWINYLADTLEFGQPAN